MRTVEKKKTCLLKKYQKRSSRIEKTVKEVNKMVTLNVIGKVATQTKGTPKVSLIKSSNESK